MPVSPDVQSLAPRQYYARGGLIRTGLVTDDVLLVPRAAPKSDEFDQWGPGFERIITDDIFRDLSHRANTDTSIFLDQEKKIKLSIPVVSAPMIDVTDKALAISLALEGGCGIIHRGMLIDEQVSHVNAVKQALGFVFEIPPTMPPNASAEAARKEMERAERGLVVVIDAKRHVLGVVTTRDVKKDIVDDTLPLSAIMSKKVITITPDIDTTDPFNITVTLANTNKAVRAVDLMWKYRIEKLIIVDKEMKLLGAITDHDIRELHEHPNAAIDQKGRLLVGAAIGATGTYLERARELIHSGADFLCLDVANAYLKNVLDAVESLRSTFPSTPLMAGTVSTRQGVRHLIERGATMIRDNTGSGSNCTTRGVSGFGVPNLTAVLECADEADKYGVPVIADGGLRGSSDLAKMIAAGATAGMFGRLFAGAEESSGPKLIDSDGSQYSRYIGMASDAARMILDRAEGKPVTFYSKIPEGVEGRVRTKGPVKDIIYRLIKGLQSGMTYGGVDTIEKLRNEIDFIRVTPAGLMENTTQAFP